MLVLAPYNDTLTRSAPVSELANSLSTPPENKIQALGKLAEILERQQIDINEIGEIKRVSLYQSLTKDQEGEAQIHDLAAIQFSPKWEAGPEWDLVRCGPTIKLPKTQVKQSTSTWKKCVVLPDIQAGFFRALDGTLVSTHDPVAIDYALSVIKAEKPDVIALNGDNADMPEMSKYRLSPAFALTTQETIDYLTTLCARLRDVAPYARIIWIEGNHEVRLTNYIIDNAKAAFGLKRGNTPESWPVLSIPFLCSFDDFNIEYLPGYPASQFWLNNRIKIIHGSKVASNGSTAHKYLATEKTSVVYGHIHRRDWAERTRSDWDGSKTIAAISFGCLARVDGAVPSTKGGMDLDGRPITCIEDWQQGLGIIHYQEGEGPFHPEMLPIHDGTMFDRGKMLGVE
jgi:predicted phosphodiesterase